MRSRRQTSNGPGRRTVRKRPEKTKALEPRSKRLRNVEMMEVEQQWAQQFQGTEEFEKLAVRAYF
jgi:hypothetical protein